MIEENGDALSEQFHHHGMPRGLQRTGYGLQRDFWECYNPQKSPAAGQIWEMELLIKVQMETSTVGRYFDVDK